MCTALSSERLGQAVPYPYTLQTTHRHTHAETTDALTDTVHTAHYIPTNLPYIRMKDGGW
jgi:hypothetical protein